MMNKTLGILDGYFLCLGFEVKITINRTWTWHILFYMRMSTFWDEDFSLKSEFS